MSPWQSVASGIGRDDLDDSSELTAQVIADGVARKYKGKKIRPTDFLFADSDNDCAAEVASPDTIRCRWWLWESGPERKGFDVKIQTDPSGVFRQILVVPIRTRISPS